MFEKIKEALSHYTFLSPGDIWQMVTISKIRYIAKDQHLVKQGDMNYNVMLILKGLVRHYVVDEQGIDKTLRFAPEKFPAASLDTLFFDKPASENIIALESCVILKVDFRAFEKLAEKNPRILKLQNQELKGIIAANVKHIKYLSLLTAEERFAAFCAEFPELEQRIKQKYVASYLGVTPTSLSRIKARVVKS